jgi:hypothetical protein
MSTSRIPVVVMVLANLINGVPLRPTQSTNGWSSEAICTLIGLFIAVMDLVVTLLASPKTRRRLKYELRRF